MIIKSLTVRSFLTLPGQPSLSPITSGGFSRLYPVSIRNWCKFLSDGQHWCENVWEFIRERRLWVRLYFSSCVPYVLIVLREWLVKYEVGGRTTVVSRICSKQYVALLYSSHLALPQCVLWTFMLCIHIVVLTQLQLGEIMYISSDRSS